MSHRSNPTSVSCMDRPVPQIRASDSRVKSLIAVTAHLKNRRRVLMGAFYQEEYRMAFTGQHPLQPTIHYPEFGSMSTDATLADAHGWMLEVARDEEAVQSD